MSRAVLLPTPGDPFLLEYWLNLYTHYWKNAVDSLYVYVNSEIPDDVIVFNADLLDKAGAKRILWSQNMVDHGRALEDLLKMVDEDHLLIIEDDGFIFKSGKVDACFQKIERTVYEVVASKRGSCSQEIIDKAETKWGVDFTSGYGDTGCNFWPNFLFISTDLLKSIGGHFGATHWDAGEMVEGLEMRVEKEAAGDTFVSASLRIRQLLDKVVPAERNELKGDNLIWYEPQYHGNTDDIPDYNAKKGIWSADCSWTHAGSLSTGVTNLLNLEKPLPARFITTEQEKLELERRVMYWSIFHENATPTGIEKFHQNYGEAIQRLINHYELNQGRIDQRKRAYYDVLPRFK